MLNAPRDAQNYKMEGLKQMSEQKLPTVNKLVRDETMSGIYIKPVFTPEDIKDINYERDLGDPGSYPYTRGIYPEMYRSRLWQKSFIVCYASPEETNAGFKKIMEKGVGGLRVSTDLACQMGLDPDHPIAWNSLMCGGTNAYAINIYQREFDGLPLENATYEMGTGGILDTVYMYTAAAANLELHGGNLANLKGSGIGNLLRSKLVYGFESWPTEIERRVMLDHIEFTMANTPKWYPFAPNGVDPNQAGLNAVHEVAEALGEAMVILDGLVERGHTLDEYGGMVFALDSDSDFFETICKYRAIRRMWAKIAKERYGAKKESTMKLKLGLRTSGMSLQAQRPLANTARVTLQILESVLAGVNSIDACSIDEAMGLPSNEARQFSLDAHNIIIHEANIPLTADPLGGSYYVEWLTNKIEQEATAYMKDVEERGGWLACLENGYLKSVLEADRLTCQREKAEGKRLIVGVNAFPGDEGAINAAIGDNAAPTPTIADREKWVAEFKQFCASRDYPALSEATRKLFADTKSGANISRAAIDAVKLGMTSGEFCGVIRMAYGLEYDFTGMVQAPAFITEALKDML